MEKNVYYTATTNYSSFNTDQASVFSKANLVWAEVGVWMFLKQFGTTSLEHLTQATVTDETKLINYLNNLEAGGFVMRLIAEPNMAVGTIIEKFLELNID
jgi:hypothetical protein